MINLIPNEGSIIALGAQFETELIQSPQEGSLTLDSQKYDKFPIQSLLQGFFPSKYPMEP